MATPVTPSPELCQTEAKAVATRVTALFQGHTAATISVAELTKHLAPDFGANAVALAEALPLVTAALTAKLATDLDLAERKRVEEQARAAAEAETKARAEQEERERLALERARSGARPRQPGGYELPLFFPSFVPSRSVQRTRRLAGTLPERPDNSDEEDLYTGESLWAADLRVSQSRRTGGTGNEVFLLLFACFSLGSALGNVRRLIPQNGDILVVSPVSYCVWPSVVILIAQSQRAGTMKIEPELLEYKLDYTPDLRCEKQTDLVPVCHSCKSCILSWKVFATREWFTRASSITQRQFVAGVIKRFRSQDLLKYTWNLLRSTYCSKDFIYSHSSVASKFLAPSTLNRALNVQTLKQSISDLWKWFLNASFWSKANYTLLLLQMCDSQLLLMAASLIRILLVKDLKVSPKTLKIDEGKAKEEQPPVQEQPKSGSHGLNYLPSHSPHTSSAFGSFFSEKTSLFGRPRIKRAWSKDSDLSSGDKPENEDELSRWLVSLDITHWPPSSQKVIICIDFIRCLPIPLSKQILRMLDSKSLIHCAHVSSHWSFLVKELRKDIVGHRALRHEITFFQGTCPKGAIANYARVVKVAIPQITKDGEIVPVTGRKEMVQLQDEYMHKAYHGQRMDNVMLEERNIFCANYNVRVLIESENPNRVIHFSGGKLMAFGSADHKIRFLNVKEKKEVRPVLSGHVGRIHAIHINEEKGILISGGYDLNIRLWNINTGQCTKIFNGHKDTILCLDLYKNKFVSGAKDGTAKMWHIVTGKCLKTFRHKATVWAAKMNGVHVVSSCDRGQVKVWHVETYVLIKTLEGHVGPVTCLSFDSWHLVTGSNDGYILGWSMVGKHNRCLMAFRHPMEVLYLGFLYLRVISACADGKVRIFNFLTGSCLRVMKANSRGDPVVSFCFDENRLLINAQGTVVLFQFEKVEWDYTLNSDRVIKKQASTKSAEALLRIKPSPHSHQEWKKEAKKKNWELYKPEETMITYSITRRSTRCSSGVPGLRYEMVTVPQSRSRNMGSVDIPPKEKKRLSCLAKIVMKTDLKDSESVSAQKGSSATEDESGHKSPVPPSSFFAHNSEALLKYMKMRTACGPITKDQVLLTISTMHHACTADHVTANMAYNMKIKDAWGPTQLQKDQPQKTLAPKSLKPQDMDPLTQLKQLNAAGGTLGISRISTPYKTKTLQLNLKNSLVGDHVQSFIPAPSLTHSRSCSSLLGETNTHSGHARIPSPPARRRPLTGLFTSANESLKVPRMKIAQPDVEAISQRKERVCAGVPNPYRLNVGFRLLSPQQIKEYEEATVLEYQANQTKIIADRQKERKLAWLRKIKGLPIKGFTKEGKIAAPELGDNVSI
uniref:F-box and WD repeat domain containing protein 10B n=1 Tax=Euleptes europaea TaxID=460621 RepID=UPI0025415719|nr:F-box and WD repeat domain containing protein 10B [Euleptes europaea]